MVCGVALACGGGPVGPLGDLVETEWRLVKIETTAGALPLPDDSPRPPGLFFGTKPVDEELRELTGSGGCNQLGGHYLAEEGGRLLVPLLWSTEMACLPPGVMEAESAFLQVLSGARAWAIGGDELTVTARSGTLTFRKATS